MKIETEFNKEHHKKQLEEYMKISLQPFSSKARNYAVVSIILLFLSIMSLNKVGSNISLIGYISLGFQVHFLFQTYNFYVYLFNTKKAYRKIVEDDIERMDVPNQVIIMEFHDNFFYYSEKDYNSTISWKMFKKIRILDGYIYLDMNRGIETSYIIGQNYVGEANFQKIKEFVSRKIDRRTLEFTKQGNKDLLDD